MSVWNEDTSIMKREPARAAAPGMTPPGMCTWRPPVEASNAAPVQQRDCSVG